MSGCSEYQDTHFDSLPVAARDVEEMERVLSDPEIGDFNVGSLISKQSGKVRREIEGFFQNRRPNDLLLLYFSCHGVLDSNGRLHFVTADTDKERLGSTGIEARWVKDQMERSRSRRIVLLLDSCYSGAFVRSPTPRSAASEEIREQLKGQGRVVIAASRALEIARGSLFTDAVVRGLDSGAADLDGDGRISVLELYDYVFKQVQEQAPNQTPTISIDGMLGELVLAQNPYSPLPAELEQAVESPEAWVRRGAVDGLRRVLAGDHPQRLQRTARETLTRLGDGDPDPDVRDAARRALTQPPPPPARRLRQWLTRHQRRLIVSVLVLALLGLLPPVTTRIIGELWNDRCSPVARSRNGVLSLGTLLPQTGSFVYYGPALDAGVRLAKEEINAAGGIPGISFSLEETNRRNEGDPSSDEALQAARELLSDPTRLDAIIGPATSGVAVKVIDDVTCSGAILFSPANTAPELTTREDHGLYFRTAPVSTLEGSVLGELVVGDGNDTAVVIARDDAYGNPLREATATTIEKAGGRVLASLPYDPDAPDINEAIRQIRGQDPDAIVVIGFTESAPILGAMIGAGLGPGDKRVYGANANMSDTFVGQVNEADSGVLAGMRGTVVEAGGEEFVDRLKKVDSGLKDFAYAAQAYDAVVVTALAAAVAGTDEPAAVAAQINGVTKRGQRCTTFKDCRTLVEQDIDIDYDGRSGPLEFTGTGEPQSATYVIAEIQPDGRVKPLCSVPVPAGTRALGTPCDRL